MMKHGSLWALAATMALAACVSGAPRETPRPPAQQPIRPPVTQPAAPREVPPAPVSGFLMPEVMRERGLEGVLNADGTALLRRFGTPRLDVFEGDMRKLQFEGQACVLDIFLYPLAPGAEPVATWVETRRRSDGAAVDRAACVAALGGR